MSSIPLEISFSPDLKLDAERNASDEGAFSTLEGYDATALRSAIRGQEYLATRALLRSKRGPAEWTGPFLASIHRDVFGRLFPKLAGSFRLKEALFGKRAGPAPEQIESLFQQLVLQICDHLSDVLAEQDLEKRFDLTFTHAATDHAEMIRIHPFIDGNGRWARIVTNIFISDAGYPPGTIVRKADKPQYIGALDRCTDKNAPRNTCGNPRRGLSARTPKEKSIAVRSANEDSVNDASALRTARLVLRAPGRSDAAAVCAYFERNATRFERWNPERSHVVAEHARWIDTVASVAARDGFVSQFLAIEARAPANGDDPAIVATIGLDGFDRAEPSAMIDYTVGDAYEGRGFAREAVSAAIDYAFGRLDLRALHAYVDVENERSLRLLARLGFTVVATMPPLPGPRGVPRRQALARLARDARPVAVDADATPA